MTSELLDLLNKNAAAVQALASLLSVIVTAVLALITWKYVQLTRILA